MTGDNGNNGVRLGDDSTEWGADEAYGVQSFHVPILKTRAVSPEVAKARGYKSTVSKDEAKKFGFTDSQVSTGNGAGIMAPVWTVDGRVAWWQYRPDTPRKGRNGKPMKYLMPTGSSMRLDVHPSMRKHLGDPTRPLFITEGIMKGDALTSIGLCTVTLLGVWNWRGSGPEGGITALGDWESIHLKGRAVYIVFDSDVMQKKEVQSALRRLHEFLRAREANVRVIYLPWGDGATKTGVDDFIASGKGLDDLMMHSRDSLLPLDGGNEKSSDEPPPAPEPRVPVPAMTLPEVEEVYVKWLGDDDLVPLRATLAAYVANMVLDGDPVWLMIVGGSGFGKTETIAPVAALPRSEMLSAIKSEAALLSGTPASERSKGATGGLLAKVGAHGMFVLKDFTTILSMNRDGRDQLLAALREIYDGKWVRAVGVDGGKTLSWEGRLGVIGASTTAIDDAYTVMAQMGSRFLFVRIGEDADTGEMAARALGNTGQEEKMRQELTDSFRGLLEYGEKCEPHEVTDLVRHAFIAVADMASLARSPVRYDHHGHIAHVGDRDAPTRIVKALMQMWRACGVIGLNEPQSWEVCMKVATGSIPKQRRQVISILQTEAYQAAQEVETEAPSNPYEANFATLSKAGKPEGTGWLTTTEVARQLGLPTVPVLRALQELEAHKLLESWRDVSADATAPTQRTTKPYHWRLNHKWRRWAEIIGKATAQMKEGD